MSVDRRSPDMRTSIDYSLLICPSPSAASPCSPSLIPSTAPSSADTSSKENAHEVTVLFSMLQLNPKDHFVVIRESRTRTTSSTGSKRSSRKMAKTRMMWRRMMKTLKMTRVLTSKCFLASSSLVEFVHEENYVNSSMNSVRMGLPSDLLPETEDGASTLIETVGVLTSQFLITSSSSQVNHLNMRFIFF